MNKTLRIILIILGALIVLASFAISGWLSWVVFIIGLAFIGLASFIAEKQAISKTDRTILCLLMSASLSDNDCAVEEQKYVLEFIKRRKLSKKLVQDVIKNAGDPSTWEFSTEESERMRILDEVAALIKADGVISEKEKEFMAATAAAIGVDKDIALKKLA